MERLDSRSLRGRNIFSLPQPGLASVATEVQARTQIFMHLSFFSLRRARVKCALYSRVPNRYGKTDGDMCKYM